jgi:predicted RNA-binding Zn-ribbon protein involved in translation (DUF1610 family)
MDSSSSTLDADDRANELYWGSDMSVNQIADTLDLSKGALYEMIRPLPTSVPCPSCGAETVHPNRTAKERGLVACPDCGWGAEGTPPPTAITRAGRKAASPERVPRDRSLSARATAPAVSRSAITAGILVGAAVGIALFMWARRSK